MGSGVRNLFKYCKLYSGQEPIFQDGDIFRIVIPLDEEYSFDYGMDNCNKEKTGVKTIEKTGEKTIEKTGVKTIEKTDVKTEKKAGIRLTETERRILGLVRENPVITQKELAEILELSNSGIRYAMKGLKEKELLFRTGSRRNGGWKLNE